MIDSTDTALVYHIDGYDAYDINISVLYFAEFCMRYRCLPHVNEATLQRVCFGGQQSESWPVN